MATTVRVLEGTFNRLADEGWAGIEPGLGVGVVEPDLNLGKAALEFDGASFGARPASDKIFPSTLKSAEATNAEGSVNWNRSCQRSLSMER
ncbi:hypothetical protein [Bradyrhizobium liaoningense]|uniref:hypothetical protein n=1 Tax=Bradyrhizobium liaoningense TaxID=43992 RepID=UPI001BACFE28|nr:hypothetical protein [Bradyrhizobium liaoningense]MBR0713963.1 hypothetical protein [Bradyrhizobium liaoningense]